MFLCGVCLKSDILDAILIICEVRWNAKVSRGVEGTDVFDVSLAFLCRKLALTTKEVHPIIQNPMFYLKDLCIDRETQ